MRSSKARSRSKQNRSRSVGNIINRVFDSSGPEGKVRGTPQQIIDKYNQLARDATLANDRVAAENFQQHSEHYTRLLGEAMRELEAQRQSGAQPGGHGWGSPDGYGQNGGQNGSSNGGPGAQGQGAQGQHQPQYGSGSPGGSFRSRNDEGAEPARSRSAETRGSSERGTDECSTGERGGIERSTGERGTGVDTPSDAAAQQPQAEPRARPAPPARGPAAEAAGPSEAPGPARRSSRARPAAKGASPAPAPAEPPEGAESLPAFVTLGSPRRSPRPSSEGPLPVTDLDEAALAAPTLVETPEDAPRPRAPLARKPRAPRTPRPAADPEPAAKPDSAAG